MTATFHVGDAIEVMSKLPEKSVDLILTSPPFLALRSYLPSDHPDKALEGGSQSTPGEYIDWLLDVVEACARVLAPHGSLVFELGDTYAGSGGAGGGDYADGHFRDGQEVYMGSGTRSRTGRYQNDDYDVAIPSRRPAVIPQKGTGWPLAKSLSLIPETFRFAMVYGRNPHTGRTTDPWRLRNVIRWVRPNPPVGALGDKFRPATSELMVFCKSAKRYFDLDAVREPHKVPEAVYNGRPATLNRTAPGQHTDPKDNADRMTSNPAGAPPLDWWNIPPGGYEGAHYAVFPPELLIKPVKAMCPEKVCRQCGEPSRRVVEKSERYEAFRAGMSTVVPSEWTAAAGNRAQGLPSQVGRSKLIDGSEFTGSEYVTTGWSDCGHDDWRPGLVLDCFGGSGTTGAVATGHGRDCILIDLDERNYELALQRVGPFILSRAESV